MTAIQWAGDFKSATGPPAYRGAAEEVVEIKLPCLLTIEKGSAKLAIPSLPGLMKAKKRPVDAKNAAALGLSAADLGKEAVGTWMGEFAPPPPARRAGCSPESLPRWPRNSSKILRDVEEVIDDCCESLKIAIG